MNAHIVLSLAHILVFIPMLFYIGFSRASLSNVVYNIVLAAGLLMGLYHLMRLIKKMTAGMAGAWVNAIHVFAVAPLLVYIGMNKKDTPRSAYELLLMVAFAGLGYHMYSLVLETQVYDTA
jgi:hypothetical protein